MTFYFRFCYSYLYKQLGLDTQVHAAKSHTSFRGVGPLDICQITLGTKV